MCNAFNHPSNCTCGWGGVGHLGKRNSLGQELSWFIPPISANYSSFTIPNASCPVCHAQVFYYKSPYGGSVFFDELGPPWPKHPCTDNASIPNPVRPIKKTEKYQWESEGWHPFFITVVISLDPIIVEIRGRFKNEDVILYGAKSAFANIRSQSIITSEHIAQIKPLEDGCFELSYFDKQHKEIRVRLYNSKIKVRDTNCNIDRIKAGYKNKTSRKTKKKAKPKV